MSTTGHRTLIGGTSYEIYGGSTLIGGTEYALEKGITLVDGTAREIMFREPEPQKITRTYPFDMTSDGNVSTVVHPSYTIIRGTSTLTMGSMEWAGIKRDFRNLIGPATISVAGPYFQYKVLNGTNISCYERADYTFDLSLAQMKSLASSGSFTYASKTNFTLLYNTSTGVLSAYYLNSYGKTTGYITSITLEWEE